MPPFDDSTSLVAARPIVKTPGTCGGDARIEGTRLSVSGLEQSRRLGISEAEMLESYPHITAADLAAALAYADAHKEEMDREIRENEEA